MARRYRKVAGTALRQTLLKSRELVNFKETLNPRIAARRCSKARFGYMTPRRASQRSGTLAGRVERWRGGP